MRAVKTRARSGVETGGWRAFPEGERGVSGAVTGLRSAHSPPAPTMFDPAERCRGVENAEELASKRTAPPVSWTDQRSVSAVLRPPRSRREIPDTSISSYTRIASRIASPARRSRHQQAHGGAYRDQGIDQRRAVKRALDPDETAGWRALPEGRAGSERRGKRGRGPHTRHLQRPCSIRRVGRSEG